MPLSILYQVIVSQHCLEVPYLKQLFAVYTCLEQPLTILPFIVDLEYHILFCSISGSYLLSLSFFLYYAGSVCSLVLDGISVTQLSAFFVCQKYNRTQFIQVPLTYFNTSSCILKSQVIRLGDIVSFACFSQAAKFDILTVMIFNQPSVYLTSMPLCIHLWKVREPSIFLLSTIFPAPSLMLHVLPIPFFHSGLDFYN